MFTTFRVLFLALAILPIALGGCSSLETPFDSDSSKSEDPDRIATIEIYNSDIDDYQTLTLHASGSGDCKHAIRQIRAKRYDEAMSTLKTHLEKKDDDARAWYALGALQEHNENYKDALNSYQNAVVNDKEASGEYQSAVDRVLYLVEE